jgi:hypothetical protein
MEARLKKAMLLLSPPTSGIKIQKSPAHEEERRSTTTSKIPRLGEEETTWYRPTASRPESFTTTVSRNWEGMEEDVVVAVQMGVPGVATENRMPDGWRLAPRINGRRPCPPMGVFID